MTRRNTIALDGPAGVGKSTIGKLLADRHGYLFLDTGVLYRAVTFVALGNGTSTTDAQALASIARSQDIEITRQPAGADSMYRVSLRGKDITEQLRTPQVERLVSEVSAHAEVRSELLHMQRRISHSGPSVLVGRDIGTVVLPNADLKIYLDAPLDERTERRYLELLEKGTAVTRDQVRTELVRRDQIDTSRAVSPLKAADDAVVVDTSRKSVDEVLAEIEKHLCA